VGLTHPLLEAVGVEHGFGLRGAPPPAGLLRPRQVHGRDVVHAAACRADPPPCADAVLSREPGVRIGVATADCVPILCASAEGDLVLAIHAGWRGLALGVVASSLDAVRRVDARAVLVAAIGPYIGPCCYEVDDPVLDALRHELGDAALAGSIPTRPGHARIDLGALAARALESAGVSRERVGRLPACCTRCDAERFHSYRRDGASAGRLVHHVAAKG
jgi:YfiH family protein